MPDELKNYRAPKRSWWPTIVATAIVVAVLTYVEPAHFADELQIEAELKVLRAERAARAPLPRAHPTPLGVRCHPYYADQADGGPWLVRCLDGSTTTTKETR